MAKTLVFFENEGQVRDYFSKFKDNKNTVFIALTPFAMYGLDELGTSYKIPEDYYELKEAYDVGIANYSKLEKMCCLVDRHIHEAWPVLAERKIRPAFFSFYDIKKIYDPVVLSLFRLSRILATEKPDMVISYASKKYTFALDLTFDNRESIYAGLLPLIKGDWQLEMRRHMDAPMNLRIRHITDEVAKEIKIWLRNHEALFNFLAKTKRDGFLNIFKSFGKEKGRAAILFGGAYNWGYCQRELEKNGVGSTIWIRDGSVHWPKEKQVNLSGAWARIREDNEFRKFFIIDGTDTFPLFGERLQYLVEKLTILCNASYDMSAGKIKKENPRVFLASTLSSCISKSAVQASRDLGLPIVVWQHGSYGYMNNPIVPYNDMLNVDYLLFYGRGVLERYMKEKQKFGAVFIPTGSAVIDSISKDSPNGHNGRNVLYATTNFYQNSLYVSIFPLFSDNLFWRDQRNILDVLGKHANYKVIVKTHGNQRYRESPMRTYAERERLKNCTFVRNERSFRELLAFADVIVIDFPSTILLEALATSKPIFTTTQYIKIDKEAEKLLKKRAFCYSTIKELTENLDKFLRGEKLKDSVDLENREFLKAYGTYLNDGKSAKRAVSFLADIIK